MFNNMQLLWFSLCFLLLLLEMGHPGLLYFIGFSCGALCASIATLYDISLLWQLAIFLLSTTGALFIVYFLTKEWKQQLQAPTHRSNLDALIGKKVVVYQSPLDNQVFLTRIAGQVWVVKNIHDAMLYTDQQVIIVDVQGCHLRVDTISPTV